MPWLKAHLFDAVDAYARGIEVDPAAIERAVGSIDPSDPESMQRAMGEGLFDLEPTPAQQAALARLETALALVEGWVDAVVDAAAAEHAAVRRRRCARRSAAAGPAAVRPSRPSRRWSGLQLRPRRLREAAALWAAVAETGGHRGPRRAVGAPRPAAGRRRPRRPGRLRRPLERGAATDWDAGLRGLDKDLDGTLDDDATGGPAGDDGGDATPRD